MAIFFSFESIISISFFSIFAFHYYYKRFKQKITKPPFRPVGKSSQAYIEKSYVDPFLQKSSSRSSRSQASRINKTSKISTTSASITKFTSTPFAKNGPIGAPKPFKKPTFLKNDKRKSTFEITTTASHITSPKKKNARKSVQFKEKITEISPASAPSVDDVKSPTSEDTNQTTIDDVRRVSHAGRTPFSCASSRSGSTPGRRDYPSKSVNITEGETITEMFASKNSQKGIKRTPTPRTRRSKSHSTLPLLKWSVRKDSIMERDPYPLRSRTPVSIINKSLKPIETSGIRSVISKSSFLSQKKKSLKVNFGEVVVNNIQTNDSSQRSPTFDSTANLFKESPPVVISPLSRLEFPLTPTFSAGK